MQFRVGAISWRRFLLFWGVVLVSVVGASQPMERPSIADRRRWPADQEVKIENRKAKSKIRKSKIEWEKPQTKNPSLSFVNPKSQIPNLKSRSFTGGTPALLAGPELSYSTFLGGSGFDIATGVAVDAAGSVYVAGYTNSIDFPASASGLAVRGGGTCGGGLDAYPCFDVFVAKFDSSGRSLIYAAIFGGSGDDIATGIAVDASGGVYLTGYTNSTDFPTLKAVQAAPGGGTCGVAPSTFPCYDAFVAKLDWTGAALEYATYLGGAADDFGQGVAVDAAGSAAVTGFTASADFPTQGPWQNVRRGSYDAFVAKFDAGGSSLIYSTFLGGTGEDYGSKLAMDPSGQAYVTGYTNSNDFPVVNAMQPTPGGGTCGAAPTTTPCFDAFISKLSGDGQVLMYSSYLGGSGGDYGYGIAVDGENAAYVTGLTTSTAFPVTPGALQTSGGGTTLDAFVAKLDADGSSLVYSTYLGGTGAEAGRDVAVDSAGHALVAGYTYGAGFPLASPVQGVNGGYYDAFIAKLNPTGSALEFSTYLGGSGNEKAHGLALDAWGNGYVAGETFSTNFPTTSGALQPFYGGGAFDGFVARLTGLAERGITSGTGSLSASNLTFGDQLVGTTSAPQTVTLSNSGDLRLPLSSIVASGDYESTSQCGPSLDPAAFCTIQVEFSPQERGIRGGTLVISPEPPALPLSVSLTGKGVAPEMNLSHAVVEFGPQVVRTASPQQTVTLANSGDAYLALTSIEVSGDFQQTNTCAGGLSAGETCAVRVVFDPKAAGARTGSLTFTNSLPHDVAAVALSGMGADFSMAVSPATQNIAAGQTAKFAISLTPDGGFRQAVTLGCAGAPRGATCAVSPSFTTLDGSNVATATVSVTTAAGSRTFPLPGRFPAAGFYFVIWLLAALALLGTGGSLAAVRPPGRIAPWLLRGALALMLVAFWTACGGGGAAPSPPAREGTPPGTYTLSVTATCGPLTHATTVIVNVQ
jgi:hypothetical protein